jgi:hypothetical protein
MRTGSVRLRIVAARLSHRAVTRTAASPGNLPDSLRVHFGQTFRWHDYRPTAVKAIDGIGVRRIYVAGGAQDWPRPRNEIAFPLDSSECRFDTRIRETDWCHDLPDIPLPKDGKLLLMIHFGTLGAHACSVIHAGSNAASGKTADRP